MILIRPNLSHSLLCLGLFLSGASLLAENPAQIEEIIVTAEKRSEPLSEVSQSISVFDSGEVQDLHIETLIDLNSLAPGVNIAKNEGVRSVVTIRGVGNEANQNTIANPSVSYHVDGIYVASPFSLLADLLDVERIEMIRGPQGTLFGQNSTGGAINITTVAPAIQEVSGAVSATLGNFDRIKTHGSVSLPIGSNMAVRTTLATNQHGGFSENVLLGQELDDADNFSGRVRFLWEIRPTTQVDLSMHAFRENKNGAALKGILDQTADPRELAQDFRSSYSLDTTLLSAVLAQDLSNATVKYLFSQQEDHHVSYRDNDRTDIVSRHPDAFLPAAVAPEDDTQTTTTHEIQWLSNENTSSTLSWIGGIFLLDTSFKVRFRELIDFGRDGVFDPVSVAQVRNFEPGDYGFISDSKNDRSSTSAYFQADYLVSDQFNLVGGLRYTDDSVEGRVTNFYGRGGTDRLTISSKRLTGRATLEYKTPQEFLVFGSLTRGFKPGGSNLTYGRENDIAPILVRSTFVDEVVDAFEIGVKGHALDYRVLFNASAFWYDYQNMQYQATDPEVFEGGVANIPEVSINGIEVEVFSALNSNLELDAKFSWLNSEIASDHLALDNVESDAVTNELLSSGYPLFGPEIQIARSQRVKNVNGNELAKAPRRTANASITHTTDLLEFGELRTKFQYVFRGEYYHRIFNHPRTDYVDSYSVLNVTSTLISTDRRWSLTLSLLNVADEPGVNSKFTDVFGVGATSVELIPPRQFLLRIYRLFE